MTLQPTGSPPRAPGVARVPVLRGLQARVKGQTLAIGMFTAAVALQLVLAAVAIGQSYFLAGQGVSNANLVGTLGERLGAAALPSVIGAAALVALKVHDMRDTASAILRCLIVAIVASGGRVGLQVLFGVYREFSVELVFVEWTVAGLGAFASYLIAYGFVRAAGALRAAERQTVQAEARAARAAEALQLEETRVRRSVSEGLHGSLQQRLVLLVIALKDIVATVESGRQDEAVRALERASAEIEDLRENSVRSLSRLLSPEGVEVGLVPALRILMGRLPASHRCTLEVSDEVRALDDVISPVLTEWQRTLLVRFVEESMTNALKHGHTEVITIELEGRAPYQRCDNDAAGRYRAGDWVAGWIQATVTDSGRGFVVDNVELSGLGRLARRAEAEGGWLTVESQPGVGTTVRMRIGLAQTAA